MTVPGRDFWPGNEIPAARFSAGGLFFPVSTSETSAITVRGTGLLHIRIWEEMSMFDLSAVQAALREFQFDAWLLCDFRGSNVLARRILDLADRPLMSRRFFYCIPAQGEPHKLVHRIETGRPRSSYPAPKTVYLRWQELEAKLAELLQGQKQVAMEYSPRNANPYVSRVDAGLVELVRSFVAHVASSGDLVQLFEAAWDDEQWQMHLAAAVHTDSAYARVLAVHRRGDSPAAGPSPNGRCRTKSCGTSRARPVRRSSADRGRRPAQRRSALRNGRCAAA